MTDKDPFLSRWSRRKLQARELVETPQQASHTASHKAAHQAPHQAPASTVPLASALAPAATTSSTGASPSTRSTSATSPIAARLAGSGEPAGTPAGVQAISTLPSPALPAGSQAAGQQPTGTQPVPGQVPGMQPPLPTLADVAELTHESDYSRFVTQGVTPQVKHAALKKLFSNPHFNVMDGLDTYIEDYGIPNPISPEMLRQMSQTQFLGLFVDEPEPATGGLEGAPAPAELAALDHDDTTRQTDAAPAPVEATDGSTQMPSPEPSPEPSPDLSPEAAPDPATPLACDCPPATARHAADLDPAAPRATPGAPDTPA